MSLPANRGRALELIESDAFKKLGSDERFEQLLATLQSAGSKPKKTHKVKSTTRKLGDIGSMTVGPSSVKLSLTKAHGAGFSKFLEDEMDDLLARYKAKLEDQ